MSSEIKMNKAEILAQLKKEGVSDLDQFADMLIKKTHKDGDENAPIIMAAIIYKHGFVSH
jgi:beta-lactamase superfamily II metal-dependent hydrolase